LPTGSAGKGFGPARGTYGLHRAETKEIAASRAIARRDDLSAVNPKLPRAETFTAGTRRTHGYVHGQNVSKRESITSISEQAVRGDAAGLTGDYAALLEQLGDVPQSSAAGVTWPQPETPRIGVTWEAQLDDYREHLLEPVELLAIFRAWEHARRGEARELLQLDRALAAELRLKPFASASLHAGRNQLQRLRPLRDEKTVQRYLRAIEAGEASGWHTLVYGLTLAVYSLPPREGMLAYARQTLGSFARRSARGAGFSEAGVIAAVEQCCGRVAPVINSLIEDSALPRLAVTAGHD